MNERIKELYIQAAEQTVKEEPTDLLARQIIHMEKFAELIVRECAEVIHKKIGPKSALDVLEHFGFDLQSKMAPGKYYIGDLCYVMDDDEWKEVCNLIFEGRHDGGLNEGQFTLKDGRRFAIYSTAWGDGTYKDQFDRDYSVDSGTIGCILADDIKSEKYKDYANIADLGNFSHFEIPFTTSGGRGGDNWDGVICIGGVKIDTN